MEAIFTTFIRTLIGFIVLLLLTRILGKKQLSQMTFFTYITGIALGNIAGDMVVHKDIKLYEGLTGLILWAVLTLLVEYISLKSSKARVLLDGEPTIVIKDGKIQKKAMASSKLNMDDLTMLLRIKNIFSITEVDYAVLEPNGQLSVLKKIENEPTIKKDLNIPIIQRLYFPTELIVDGKVVHKNLKELGLKEEWLNNQIKVAGFKSPSDVFYAEIQSDGKLFMDKMDGA